MKCWQQYGLCVIQNKQQVLLGLKKRGLNAGRWNGFGGKVHCHESIIDATYREVKEESTLVVVDLVQVGMIVFDYPHQIMQVSVFYTSQFSGVATESEEMMPRWFDIDQIPYDQMCGDVRYWMPFVINQIQFAGWFQVVNNRLTGGCHVASK